MAACIDISSAVDVCKLLALLQALEMGYARTHLRVVLERGVVGAGADTDTD